jgi:hypothetical protein
MTNDSSGDFELEGSPTEQSVMKKSERGEESMPNREVV